MARPPIADFRLHRFVWLGVALALALGACVDSRLRDAVEGGGPRGEVVPPFEEEGGLEGGVLPPPRMTGSTIPLFQDATRPVEVELEGDFPLLNDRRTPGQPVSIGSMVLRDGSTVERLEVRFAARPNASIPASCRYLPIRILLPVERTTLLLRDLRANELLFFSHCAGGERVSEQSDDARRVFHEFRLHRLLASLGLPHAQVRLAQVTFRNRSGRAISESHGFFRETPEDLAARYSVQVMGRGEAEALLPKLDPRYRIQPELAGQLAGLASGFALDVYRGPGPRGITLTVPELRASSLLGSGDCRGRDCWNDEAFFRGLLTPRLAQGPKWRRAVLREMGRVLTMRAAALASQMQPQGDSQRDLPGDAARFRRRIDAYFQTLDAVLKSQPSE